MHKTPVYRINEILEFNPTDRARIIDTEAPDKEPLEGQRIDTAHKKAKRLLGISFSMVHPKRSPGVRFSLHTATTIHSVEMSGREWLATQEWMHDVLWGDEPEWAASPEEERRRLREIIARGDAREPERLAAIERRTRRAQRMWWRQFPGIGKNVRPLSEKELDYVRAACWPASGNIGV